MAAVEVDSAGVADCFFPSCLVRDLCFSGLEFSRRHSQEEALMVSAAELAVWTVSEEQMGHLRRAVTLGTWVLLETPDASASDQENHGKDCQKMA